MKSISKAVKFFALLFLLCIGAATVSAIADSLFGTDPTPTPTYTPAPPTPTATDTATVTPTVTGTPPTPTLTPTASETPLPPTATPTHTATVTPTPIPPGMSREAPASIGVQIRAQDDVTVVVNAVARGSAAWKKIQDANMFNSRPGSGREYVLVTFTVGYSAEASKTRSINPGWFRAVGSNGAIYSRAPVVLSRDFGIELFGGGSVEGELAFEVAEGETGLMVIYDSGIGTSAWYLALE